MELLNYDNLPSNWHHADLTHDEIKAQVRIFSSANLSFGLLKFASNLAMKYQCVMDKFVEEAVTKGLMSIRTDTDNIPRINRAREARVYEGVDRLEKREDTERIGVFYGVAHLPYLEEESAKRICQRWN